MKSGQRATIDGKPVVSRLLPQDGVTLEVFRGKLRIRSENEPDESLVRLLRDNKQAVVDAILAAETETERWRRRLAETIETIMTIRGLSRLEAERVAFDNLVTEYLNSTHPDTPSDRCCHCGRLEMSSDPLLPIGVGDRHAWLHSGCHVPWRERRKAEAEEDLARLGVAKPEPDYALILETHLKLALGNYPVGSEEPKLRAIEKATLAYRQDHGCDIDAAKAAVLHAIESSS
jgi:hypothetical protein